MVSASVVGCQAPVRDEAFPDFSAVDAVLAEDIARDRIPFAEVLVYRRGRQIYHGRVGHPGRIPVARLQEDVLYRIASLSKPMTSFAALRLIDAGVIGLEDPVARYLPEFSLPASGMTIRHLLAHTAGISYPLVDGDEIATAYRQAGLTNGALETRFGLDALPSRIAALPLANEPGRGWRYGLATDVLGRVLEVATGKVLPDVLDTYLLEPLGMEDSHFIVPVGKRDRLLPIFEIDGDARLRHIGSGKQRGGPYEFSVTYPTFSESRYFSGGGGIVASARDLGTFVSMLSVGGVHDGQRLLSRALFDEFRRDQTEPFGTGIDGVGFGLGIGLRLAPEARGTRGPVGELFWSGIFFTTFWVDPERGIAGVFLTQMRPDQRSDTARRVQNAVFEVLYRSASH